MKNPFKLLTSTLLFLTLSSSFAGTFSVDLFEVTEFSGTNNTIFTSSFNGTESNLTGSAFSSTGVFGVESHNWILESGSALVKYGGQITFTPSSSDPRFGSSFNVELHFVEQAKGFASLKNVRLTSSSSGGWLSGEAQANCWISSTFNSSSTPSALLQVHQSQIQFTPSLHTVLNEIQEVTDWQDINIQSQTITFQKQGSVYVSNFSTGLSQTQANITGTIDSYSGSGNPVLIFSTIGSSQSPISVKLQKRAQLLSITFNGQSYTL